MWRNLERELTSGPEEVGVISGGCRRVTETLADITLQNNIVHVRPTWLHLINIVIILTCKCYVTFSFSIVGFLPYELVLLCIPKQGYCTIHLRLHVQTPISSKVTMYMC